MLETDPDDDIIVMVWHRDNEDALILLGWERTETLQSKVETQTEYSGEEPEKLAHLSARPMNELHNLGPNTAHLNQKPENPFLPGDRVVKAEADDASVAVVVEVLPPEKNTTAFGQTMDGEAVNVAYPEMLDDGPSDWRKISPAKLASYCYDQDIKLYTYKHTNLEYADKPFAQGDYVIKPDYDDPDRAVIVDIDDDDDRDVTVAFLHHLAETVDGEFYQPPNELASYCKENDIKMYSYEASSLEFKIQY